MESSRYIDRIIGIRKILDICLRCFLVNSDIFSVDRDPGINGLGIQDFCTLSKCIGNCCTSVFVKLVIQAGQLVLHLLIYGNIRELITFCTHRNICLCIKKCRSKIRIQCLIHKAHQTAFINLIALYLTGNRKFFLCVIILDRCICRRGTFPVTKMVCCQCTLFLLGIFVDFVRDIYILLFCKDLAVCLSLLLKFCKLRRKVIFIQAVTQIFQSQTVDIRSVFLKNDLLILECSQDLLLCILHTQFRHIQSIDRDLAPQRIRICHMDIGKKSHYQCHYCTNAYSQDDLQCLFADLFFFTHCLIPPALCISAYVKIFLFIIAVDHKSPVTAIYLILYQIAILFSIYFCKICGIFFPVALY